MQIAISTSGDADLEIRVESYNDGTAYLMQNGWDDTRGRYEECIFVAADQIDHLIDALMGAKIHVAMAP